MLRKIVARDTLAIFAALCCLVLFMPASAQAQGGTTFKYTLTIPTIPGDSTNPLTPNAIDVQSFTFGASNTVVLSNGVWKAGRAVFQNLTFTSEAGKASPFLFQTAATGFPNGPQTAVLTGRGDMSDGRQITIVYTLSDVFVVGYQLGGNNGGVPTESTALAYGSFTADYTAVSLTGTIHIRKCFNMEIQAAC
jgi:type VI protein secretion system component Hcp